MRSGWKRFLEIRTLLLAILTLGILGTSAELVLLEHWEEWWQQMPLVVLGIGFLALLLQALRPSAGSLAAFRVVMVLFVVTGLLGLTRHYKGNTEFELEMYPSMAGLELFWESITGATPALAPGVMIQLGLVGLAYAFGLSEVRNSLHQRRNSS